MSKKAIVIYILISAVILSVLALGVVFIYRSTNGFKENIKTFTVEYEEQELNTTESSVSIRIGAPNQFKLSFLEEKYKGDKANTDYSISIYANHLIKESFTVDEKPVAYNMLGDITKAFTVVKNNDGFTIETPNTMTELLNKLYPETIIGCKEYESEKNYFNLIVQNEDTVYSINLNFGILVEEIKSDTAQVIF